MGINRHLTLDIVHGPPKYQGVGIPDLWTVQGILKLWITLRHGDAPKITGNQLRASMELHTLEIGLPGQLLRQDYKIYGHLSTLSWLNTSGSSATIATFNCRPRHPHLLWPETTTLS